jgi:hypothetical protein
MKIINRKINIKIIALFSISLLGFYFLNLYTNIRGDDFLYKFIFTIPKDIGIRGIRVESFLDIITSQYNHYFVQNGRILLSGLVQLFLIPENKLWFNIVNTLLFGLFQFLILKRSTNLNIKNEYQYLILIIFLWFLVPSWNFTFLWLAGSINYVWALVLVLLFFDLFDRINLKNLQVRNKYLLLILFFGCLCGFTYEGITIGVSGALCIALLKNFKHYKISLFVLIFGFLLGTVIMSIAPGNMIRFNSRSLEDNSLFYMILQRCYGFFINFKHLGAFWLMMVMFSVLYVKDRTGLKRIYREHELLIHSIFISLAFLFVVRAYHPPRVYFGVSIFSIIVILSISRKYFELFFSNKSKIMYAILFLFVIIEFTQVVGDLRANKFVFEQDEENWLKSDHKVFVLSKKNINRFSLPLFINGPDDFSDRYSWPNKNLSWYYKKQFIMFISRDLYENVYQSNKFIGDKSLLNTISLKKSSEGIKLYKSPKNNFLIYKVPDSISKNILEGARVKYQSNKVIKYNKSGYFNRVKSAFGANEVSKIRTEMKSCFVLPTIHGNYLVLYSPTIIPFENLEEILIYPSIKDTTPILSF